MNKNDRPLGTLDHNPLVSYFMVEDNDPDCDQEHREDARAVGKLLALRDAGAIQLMVAVSTTLENPRPGKAVDLSTRLKDLGFEQEDIGVHLRHIGFATADTPDMVTYDMELEHWFSSIVHAKLFEGKLPPGRNIHFRWQDFRDSECERRGITGSERYALAHLDYVRMHPHWTPTPLERQLEDSFYCNLSRHAAANLTDERRTELDCLVTQMHHTWWNAVCDSQTLIIHMSHALLTSVSQHAVFVTRDRDFLKPATLASLKSLGLPGHILKPEDAAKHFLEVAGVSLPDEKT